MSSSWLGVALAVCFEGIVDAFDVMSSSSSSSPMVYEMCCLSWEAVGGGMGAVVVGVEIPEVAGVGRRLGLAGFGVFLAGLAAMKINNISTVNTRNTSGRDEYKASKA